MKAFCIGILFFWCTVGFVCAQIPQNTLYVNTLSTHPLGVFGSRVKHNFQAKAVSKLSVNSQVANGNVWLPQIVAYTPTRQSEQERMRNIVWHKREFFFDLETEESTQLVFEADGVLRFFTNSLQIPLHKQHELWLSTRMFSLDKGKRPFSILTNDAVIEWFHKNFTRDTDPFGRENYALDEAKIRYLDEDGRQLDVDDGDFVFSGIDVSYFYYPKIAWLEKHKIYTHLGVQSGLNFNAYNRSLDLGIQGGVVKPFVFKKENQLRLNFSFGLLYQSLIGFSKFNVKRSSNKLIFSSETQLEYVKGFKKHQYISVALGFSLQSPYNKKSDFEKTILTGDRRSTHWHYTFSHLYRYTTANTLTISYGFKDFVFWAYLREDLLVDNAPDVQTGIGFRVFLNAKL